MTTKILLSVILLTLFLCSVNAQVIPNYNFETWTNGVNSAPDGWTGKNSNHIGFYPVTQTNDKYLGNYAVRIENKVTSTDTTKGEIFTTRPGGLEGFGPAFPIASRYNNLKGYYKYTPLNGDSAQIIVFLTKTGFVGPWGNLLAWGQKNLGAAATYIPFTVGYLDSLSNFIYNDNILIPDSGYINIAAFKGIGGTSYNLKPRGNSVLIVDAINFDSFITGINGNNDITENFVLYPNVNNGIFNVSFHSPGNEFTTIKIYDIDGKEILHLFSGIMLSGDHAFQYNLPDIIKSGNYFYMVSSATGYRTERFCIQK